MKKKSKTKQNLIWERLNPTIKSNTAQLLYHFYWEKKGHWYKHESSFVFELIRALDILPKRYFLKKFIIRLKEKIPQKSEIFDEFIKRYNCVSFNLFPETLIKRNNRSDIELKLGNKKFWIEAKMHGFGGKNLSQFIKQLDTQENSPAKPEFVIALLPKKIKCAYEKRIDWEDVISILEEGVKELLRDYKKSELTGGYIDLASELINRLESVLSGKYFQ